MSTTLRVVVTGLCFAVVFLTGFWLSRSGRPLNVAVSTIHKLVALAAAVFLVLIIRQVNQVGSLSVNELAATVVTGLLFLSLAATGALLSGDKPTPAVVQKTHHIVPYLTVLSSAATLYLLLGR